MMWLIAFMLLLMQDSSSAVLRFDWPAGVTARIDTEYSWDAEIDQMPVEVSRLSFSQRMRVRPHDEGRRIEYADHTYIDSSGDLLQAVKGVVTAWVPVTIVSDRGTFLRVEEAHSVSRLLTDAYAPLIDEPLARAVPAFKAFLTQMSSPEALAVMMAAEWNELVGRWLGMAPADTPAEHVGDVARGGGGGTPSRTTVRLVEQTSCSRGARAYDCVTYELTSEVEPAGLARLAQSIPQEALGMRVSVHEIIRTVRVTLETETMLPHRFEMTQKMRQTRELGSAVNITDVERRVSRYTYLDER
jgi:hypothetical protein